MKRTLPLMAVALGIAISLPTLGCELVIDAEEEDVGIPLPNPDPVAESIGQFNRDVLPLLDVFCEGCHDGERVGIGFMERNPTAYASVTTWPGLVNREVPSQSRLINKGLHEGPSFTTEAQDLITQWLLTESQL